MVEVVLWKDCFYFVGCDRKSKLYINKEGYIVEWVISLLFESRLLFGLWGFCLFVWRIYCLRNVLSMCLGCVYVWYGVKGLVGEFLVYFILFLFYLIWFYIWFEEVSIMVMMMINRIISFMRVVILLYFVIFC